MPAEHIGERIARRRKDLGLTQPELGKLCGVDPITISRWERGKVEPSRHYAMLSQALKIDIEWLIFGEREVKVQATLKAECVQLSLDLRAAADVVRKASRALPGPDKPLDEYTPDELKASFLADEAANSALREIGNRIELLRDELVDLYKRLPAPFWTDSSVSKARK